MRAVSSQDEPNNTTARVRSRGSRGSAPPRKATAKARAREADIYAAAAKIFHEKGYAATSLQDIADAVGILKGSLYYYIDSKEDLLYRISRTIHDVALENVAEVRAAGGTASDRLRLLLRQHVAQFGKNLSMIRVFYTEYGALTGKRRREILRDRHAYEAVTAGLIEEGKRAGEFCTDLDTRLACNAILTMVNSVHMWYGPSSDLHIDQVAEQMAELALRGLACPPGHRHGTRK